MKYIEKSWYDLTRNEKMSVAKYMFSDRIVSGLLKEDARMLMNMDIQYDVNDKNFNFEVSTIYGDDNGNLKHLVAPFYYGCISKDLTDDIFIFVSDVKFPDGNNLRKLDIEDITFDYSSGNGGNTNINIEDYDNYNDVIMSLYNTTKKEYFDFIDQLTVIYTKYTRSLDINYENDCTTLIEFAFGTDMVFFFDENNNCTGFDDADYDDIEVDDIDWE